MLHHFDETQVEQLLAVWRASKNGSNPFATELITLDQQIYRLPSQGFQTRLIILLSLSGLVILMGMTYLALMAIDYRRKAVSFSTAPSDGMDPLD